MSDTSELIESAQRLEFRAEVGDMGRKPDPTDSLRIAAKRLRKADATITSLRAEQSSFYAKGWNDAMAAAAELNTAELAEARPKALREAAKVAESHRYGDSFLDSCHSRKEHRQDIAQAIRAMIDKEATMEGAGG